LLDNIATLPVLWDGPEEAQNLFIFAHGAGAPMDTDFMNFFAFELAKNNIRVLRFEFPYMALRREGHGKRPPNTQKILFKSWCNIIEECRSLFNGSIYIGGKSMGGRMASMIADQQNVSGLICLGYPFYAPGKKDKPRIDHLQNLMTKTLILQGERDAMGSREIVETYKISNKISISWSPDGDHSLKPRKKSGFTEKDNFRSAFKSISQFIE